MKNRLLYGAAAVALAMSSCSTIQHTAGTAGVDTHVYNLTVAELDVAEKKAEKTYNWSWNPFRTMSLAREKQNVTARLLDESGADVLVEPQFEVSRRGIFRGGSITVTGFPAKYKNFHAMTRDEAEIISISNGTYPGTCANPCATSAVKPQTKAGNAKKVMPVSIFNRGPLSLRETTAGRAFATVVGGIAFAGDFESGYQVGLMIGRHGNRWSKYAKIMVNHASLDEWSDDDGGKTSAQLTVGTVYRASGALGIFGGLGVGGSFERNHEWHKSGDDRLKTNFAVPVELGVQVNINSRFNAIAGVSAPLSGSVYVIPMLGIGYTF